MTKRIKNFLAKQFSDAYWHWLEESIDKAQKNNDTIGLASLEEAKSLYFLDYMNPWFEECATIAANMASEVEL